MRAYAAERLPLRLLLPVASLLAMAAGADRTVWQLASDTMLALSLFVQFRIWDDIEDRPRDGVDHPSRALVGAPSVRPFQFMAVALGVVDAIYLVSRSAQAAALYLALAAILAIWYSHRAGRTVGGECLLLAKYPVFVAIVAMTRPIERPVVLSFSVLGVYGAACIYEAWHDSSSALRWMSRKGVAS